MAEARRRHPALGWAAHDFKSLRKSFGTVMAQRLRNPRDLMTLMGHSRLETSLKYYTSTEGLEGRLAEVWADVGPLGKIGTAG